ncbi:hypothetical protein LTR56_010536 [Elasticomyces elasticus]|nr:hypothetical protein LTR56_010536 [Elasticomyces elasticus]KAK3657952.1 hypothetical protein LTR22_009179 [Elasticomyces elasticus]KAK5762859.1 hypothetical protein LTS12_007048 [Elasticomyces elasticus]
MKAFTTAVLLNAITMVTASVDFGTSDVTGNNVAWWGGASPCTGVKVSSQSENPCGKHFWYRGHEYFLKGCGTSDFSLYNGDGSFNHKCGATSYNEWCGYSENDLGNIHQSWSC